MNRLLCSFLAIIVFSLLACDGSRYSPDSNRKVLKLAVTTSTRDSGLLDKIGPIFEKKYNARLDIIAKGTGAAINLGQSGDVDVILVHARAAEDQFMAAGFGSRREDVMFNTFELLGPESDPACIKGMEVTEALKKIAAEKKLFVSRGDDSGTHKRELKLWDEAGGLIKWAAYLECGQGMGAALTMAYEKNAYVLSDRGTYLNFKNIIDLIPLSYGSKNLKNPYGVIVVNPKKHASVNSKLANQFVDFLISAKTQKSIADFKIEGEQLFYPYHLKDKQATQKESRQ